MSAAPAHAPPQEACFHCAEPLGSDDVVFGEIGPDRVGFCCHGCLGAAQLIHGLGLGAYYERRDMSDAELLPLAAGDAQSYERFDDAALQRRFVSCDEEGIHSTSLSVSGMRCAACSWLLEERLVRLPGVREAHFGLASGRAQLHWDPAKVQLSEILGAVAALGYRALPFEPDTAEAMVRGERRAALRRLGVAGLGTMQVMMFSVALYLGAAGTLQAGHRDILRLAGAIVTTPVLLYAGWPFLAAAWRDLRMRRIGPDVPIALALLGAYLASLVATVQQGGEVYFDSVCMFVFFITLGRTLERDLRAKAELRIGSLLRRVPETAHRKEDGAERDVPVADLVSGDIALVRPGERIPADGVVIEGAGEVSESLLTGEASPVVKRVGSTLLAGSDNLDGTLRLRVERTGAASTLQQIASLLDRAQLEKPPIAVLAGRVAQVFVTSVVLLAAVVGLAWWWIDASRVVPIVVSVLIATCPCALSLATPSALAAATHGLAARGFLITRGHVLEALAGVGRVVFDKTGTLTAATPRLTAVQPLRDSLEAAEALRLARLLEEGSSHPIARALRGGAGSAARARVGGVRSKAEPGAGVEGEVEGRTLRLGRPDWSVRGRAQPAPPGDPGSPTTSVLLADEAGALAWFTFELPLRSGAAAVTRGLEAEGYRTALLSGDPSVRGVAAIADPLGISEAVAGASPAEKVEVLEGWIARGETVMAVGDGINDAPLLGRAHVSAAMGSGSDLARLRADAVLLDDRLASIPLALHWAKRTKRVMKQNFAWALAYNLCVLPLAATGLLAPWQAAIGMSASSLLVVGNSLRLRRAGRTKEAEWAPSTC